MGTLDIINLGALISGVIGAVATVLIYIARMQRYAENTYLKIWEEQRKNATI